MNSSFTIICSQSYFCVIGFNFALSRKFVGSIGCFGGYARSRLGSNRRIVGFNRTFSIRFVVTVRVVNKIIRVSFFSCVVSFLDFVLLRRLSRFFTRYYLFSRSCFLAIFLFCTCNVGTFDIWVRNGGTGFLGLKKKNILCKQRFQGSTKQETNSLTELRKWPFRERAKKDYYTQVLRE